MIDTWNETTFLYQLRNLVSHFFFMHACMPPNPNILSHTYSLLLSLSLITPTHRANEKTDGEKTLS
jgi:hypothetical protein